MFETLFNTLGEALTSAQADWRAANHNYTNPLPEDDSDDVRWAYKAQLRAEHRLRQLGVRNFDVA